MSTTEDRDFLPALPRSSLLRFYDPLSRLIRARDMHWQLIAQAAIEPGATVLEIGTGTGNVLLLVKRAVPEARVIGLDPDAAALAIAARKASGAGLDVQLDRGYADRLPYPDGSIDRVLSSLMFHHLPATEKATTLREVRRVLVPGGRLHLLDFDHHPAAASPVARFLSRGHSHGAGHHGHILARDDPQSVLAQLGEAGFVDAAVAGHGTSLLGGYTFYRASR